MTFSPRGLESMRDKYGLVNGAPAFLREIFRLDLRSQELRALLRHPELSPYFPCADGRGGFLLINNQPYDPGFRTYAAPKAQKLTDDGIHLCAWFVHPEEASVDAQTRALLEDLTPGPRGRSGLEAGPMLRALRAQLDTHVAGSGASAAFMSKPNHQLSSPLTSILDLRPHHAAVLADLKAKISAHLRVAYGVDVEHDQVDMFCHFPYRDVTTPLHVQVRVNQTLHPTDASSAFSLDELIAGLSQPRNTIDIMVLQRQRQNGECFYRPKVEFSEFGDLAGVGFVIKKNVFRLGENASPSASPLVAGTLNSSFWLHANRTFGVPVDGRLEGVGAAAVLTLGNTRYAAQRELGRGYSSIATLFESDTFCEQVVVKSLRGENIGAHQIVLYKEYHTLMHLERALSNAQRDTVVLPLGAVVGDDGLPSLVFPYHAGGTVKANVQRLSRLLEVRTIRAHERLELTKLMMLDMAYAKQTLEAADIVHIDPRDDNFVVGADGRTRLIDFGCAEIITSRTGPLPRDVLEQNLTLPVSYHSGDDLRPPGDSEVGASFDSYVIGGVFSNMMRPILDEVASQFAGESDDAALVRAECAKYLDLSARMLCERPAERPNATELLEHPLFDTLRGGGDVALRTQLQDLIRA